MSWNETEPLLRQLAKKYGPVEVAFIEANDPFVWTVSLVSTHDGTATWNHEHGERLVATLTALWDQLEKVGVVTVDEAMRLGGAKP